MASVYLPVSLLRDGDLAFTPDEAPHMFSWTYRTKQEERMVRFESWDQQAVNLFTWQRNQTAPGLVRLGSIEQELSPELTARELRAAGQLVPRQPDYFLVPSVDPERRGYVNTFGPGAGLTALPFFAIESLFVDDLAHNKTALWYGAKFVAAFCVAASVALVYWIALEFTGSGAALLIASAYGAGTCVWSISSQTLWQSGPNVLFLSLAAWCLVRMKQSDWWAAPCAVAAAWGVVCRPTSALFVIAIGLYLVVVAWQRWHITTSRWFAMRPLVIYAIAGLPLALWLGYHNWYYLGSPWLFGDMVASRELALQKVGVADVWYGSWFEGFYGLLISPSRGMLVFSPVLGFALWGAIQAWRDPRYAVLRPFSLTAVLVVCLSAKWYDWAGGWSFGYRLLVDTMPLLALCSVAVVERIRRLPSLKALLAVALLWSVGVQVIGAYAYDVTGWNNRKAYAVRLPGEKQPRLFHASKTAEQVATKHHVAVQPVYLNIDLKPYHRRLWSIRDSQLVYYLTHFAASRQNKKRMIEEFLRPQTVGKDEWRRKPEGRSSNDELRPSGFVIPSSFEFRHSSFPRLRLSGHGYEKHGNGRTLVDRAVEPFFEDQQFLRVAAHGDDQATAGGQLVDERRRDFRRGGGNDDHVEGGFFRPALIAVALADHDVLVAQLGQAFFGLFSQRLDDLDAVNLPAELGQHGRLIAGTGADIEGSALGLRLGQLGHQGNDVRLGNRLPMANRQRMVSISNAGLLFGNEAMAGNPAHHLQDLRIDDVAAAEIVFEHSLPGLLEPGGVGIRGRRFTLDGLLRHGSNPSGRWP